MNIKALILIAAIITPFTALSASEKSRPPVVLKWMVAHSPNNYFVEMAKHFKKRVESETSGRVKIEIIDDFQNEKDIRKNLVSNTIIVKRKNLKNYLRSQTIPGVDNQALKEVIDSNHTGGEVFANRLYAFKLMMDGKIDMAQGYTYFLAKLSNPDYHALELPFLFDDYDHIEKFIASDAGKNLLASTAESKGFRGLAYTFSGGLLLTLGTSSENFSKVSEWQGKEVRKTGSLVRDLTLNQLGANLSNVQKNQKIPLINSRKIIRPTQLISENLINAEEINLPDVQLLLASTLKKSKDPNQINQIKKLSITETQHVLLSTVFLINEKSFNKMNEEDRVVVQNIAEEASKIERDFTIKKYTKAKQYLLKHGFKWNNLTEENREEYVKKLGPVYDEIYKQYPNTKKIVEHIKALKVNNKKMADN